MKFLHSSRLAAALLGVTFCAASCITENTELGSSMIPAENLFDTYLVDIPLDEVMVQPFDSISGYSNNRITIGALRDPDLGLTTRASAITLVPLNEHLDFGKNPEFIKFHVAIEKDTTSVRHESEKSILQNIYVYELDKELDTLKYTSHDVIPHGAKRLTDGTPVYDGGDSLVFNLSKEYGERFFAIDTTKDLADIHAYLKKFPGLYIESEAPVGSDGGRINLFKLQLDYDFDYYYIKGNYAELYFRSEYEGVKRDTSFFFYFSPTKFHDMDSLFVEVKSSGTWPQYCQNVVTHESFSKAGSATDKIYVEGGAGLMPMVPAKQIRDAILADAGTKGVTEDDVKRIVVNKASLVLPFEFPSDYKDLNLFPTYLSPCKRISYTDRVSYANLTDYSAEDEDPGKINRSVGKYSPDVTYHVQQMVRNGNDSNINQYNIWFTILASEVEKDESSSSSNSSLADYYNYLSYASYYNQLYGGYGGYGSYGYGGYGGYGYGGYGSNYYSNYYSYMLAAMYSQQSSSSTETATVTLDKDRFYKAILNGPTSSSDRPYVRVVYSVPKKN